MDSDELRERVADTVEVVEAAASVRRDAVGKPSGRWERVPSVVA